MTIAGSFVADEVLSSTANIISSTPELQAYSVHKLYRALKENIDQQGLVILSVWLIGEYGDLLTKNKVTFPDVVYNPVTPTEINNILEKLLVSNISDVCKEYILTCALKLSVRAAEFKEQYRKLLTLQSAALNVELQQRACEYGVLLDPSWDRIRGPLLEKMPTFIKNTAEVAPAEVKTEKNEEVWLMDLLGDGGSAPLISENLASVPVYNENSLLDINLVSINSPLSAQTNNLLEIDNVDHDFQEFKTATAEVLTIKAFEDNEILISFFCTKGDTEADTVINCVCENKANAEISDFKLFSAVQKHLVLNISLASSTRMNPKETISQQLKINNTQHRSKSIVIRLKFDYVINGMSRSKIATVDSIPHNY